MESESAHSAWQFESKSKPRTLVHGSESVTIPIDTPDGQVSALFKTDNKQPAHAPKPEASIDDGEDDKHEDHEDLDEAIEEVAETADEAGEILRGEKEGNAEETLKRSFREVIKDWFTFKKENFKENWKEYLTNYIINLIIGGLVLLALVFIGLPVAVIGGAIVAGLTLTLELLGASFLIPLLVPVINTVLFILLRSPAIIGKFMKIPEGLGTALGIGTAAIVGLPWFMGAFGGLLVANFIRASHQLFYKRRWIKKKAKKSSLGKGAESPA